MLVKTFTLRNFNLGIKYRYGLRNILRKTFNKAINIEESALKSWFVNFIWYENVKNHNLLLPKLGVLEAKILKRTYLLRNWTIVAPNPHV